MKDSQNQNQKFNKEQIERLLSISESELTKKEGDILKSFEMLNIQEFMVLDILFYLHLIHSVYNNIIDLEEFALQYFERSSKTIEIIAWLLRYHNTDGLIYEEKTNSSLIITKLENLNEVIKTQNNDLELVYNTLTKTYYEIQKIVFE
jgi:hypothetical protein